MNLSEAIITGLVSLVGGGGLGAWLTSRGKQRIDLIALGQTVAAATIEGLKSDRDSLLGRIDALEGQIMALKEQLEELLFHAESLEGVLKAHSIAPPPRPRKRL